MSGRRRLAVAVAAGVTFGLTGAGMVSIAAPARAAAEDYVKYYQVGSAAETLGAIAQRTLGAAGRATEIYEANVGRRQPDGGMLGSASGPLHAGWVLVLPWDAVGTGVKYGMLPTAAPPASSAAPAPTRSTAAPKPRAGSATPAAPRAPAPRAPAPKAPPKKPARTPPPKKAPKAGSTCQTAVRNPDPAANWASLRLAPDQAWTRTRGRGQTVAIVDSGADGTLPQLAARTSPGMDVVGGTGQGNADCLGSGTAMASIVAAQPLAGSPLVGVAPDATVLPVRVATTRRSARADDVATAVRMAVSKSATVIVLGAYADTTDRTVATALHDAVQRGVVVVAPALPAGRTPDPAVAALTAGVVRVGGVGVDGRVMAGYRPGGVHLVAPGRDVAALGITGVGILPVSGAQYAAAFVGATAALVRAAYPELSAAEVVRRLEATADRMPDSVPDGRYGWGLVSPRSAVDTVLAEEAAPPDPVAVAAARQRSRQLPALLVIIALGLVVTVLLAVRVRKLVVDRDTGPAPDRDDDPPGPPPPGGAAEPVPSGRRPGRVERGPTGVGAGSEWSREAASSGLAYWGKS